MARLFISFLGKGNYQPCKYSFGDIPPVEQVNFVQEAIARKICANWSGEDRIRVFCTDESERKNWLGPEGNSEEGLEHKLMHLKIKPSIESVKIPIGKQEDEIREIFNITYDTIQDNDEIIIDITHSFRSIPFIVSAVINYAQALKNISVQGIYYGAYEARDTKTNIAPILDLSEYANIINWAWATREFVNTGETTSLNQLITAITKPKMIESKCRDMQGKGLDEFSKGLKKTSRILKLNRGSLIISQLDDFTDRIKLITPYIDQYPLLEKLLERIKKKTSGFKKGEISNIKEGIKWCAEHNLVPQYLTCLHEGVITYLCNYLGKDFMNKKNRDLISHAVNIRMRKIPKEKWHQDAKENLEIVTKVCELIDDEAAKHLNKLYQLRNDVNHYGMLKNAMNIKKLETEAVQLKDPIERFLNSIEVSNK